ncbi:uncharacterized protein Dwil_GK10738 [Drosophila willistoni]|uniref:Protein stum n=1 Tax=Drosophila willistoni TaxID=7260 RepID=B4MIV9_DROWI|nr:uncharacterized protein Dwil_GK10738 [Drosophila willistoni]
MQQTLSYSSSSPSPTATPIIGKEQQNYSYHSNMPPSTYSHIHSRQTTPRLSTTIGDIDGDSSHQYNSLFGDPVPPLEPADYYATNSAFESLRTGAVSTSVDLPSSEEDALVAAVALISNESSSARERRLFPNVPYLSTSSYGRGSGHRLSSLPQLKPPDIQILPNSSGGSSSDQMNSPNFRFLAPDDILNKPDLYDLEKIYHDDDMATQVSGISQVAMSKVSAERCHDDNCSSVLCDPYANRDWFRPATQHFPEFSRIPKLRPSSKMIMSMRQEEAPLSPLATMIQDMNSSSSGGEERLGLSEMDIILSPKSYLEQQQRRGDQGVESYATPPSLPPPPAAPPPCHEATTIMREMSPIIIKDSISVGGDYRVEQPRLHKKTAFTIITERSPQSSRAQSPKGRRTPSPSQPPPTHISPAAKRHASIQSTSTTSSFTAKLKPPIRRKSLTGSRLPQLPMENYGRSLTMPADDSPRPSVQFNMSGRYNRSKLGTPSKGILQQRDSLTSSIDTYTPRNQRRSSIAPLKIKSMETLPLITDPYRSSIPRFHHSNIDLIGREPTVIPPGSLPRPLKPNANPTRKQRGLLRVMNREDAAARLAPSHIPPRSNWSSLDDLVMDLGQRLKPINLRLSQAQRRRSSSTSPERRSSTQTASDRRSSNLSSITVTSDLSFRRRPSLATLPTTTAMNRARRKSIHVPASAHPSPRRQSVYGKDAKHGKIVKPSTLSPIIGTPNKDSSTPQSPLHGLQTLDTPSEVSTRRDSISRIPIRSRPESRMESSRGSSPIKDFLGTSGRTSRASNSRSPSRAPSRENTRTPSRAPSRENIRTPSRAPSRENIHTSRAPSRENFHTPFRAPSRENSRSISRASTRNISRGGANGSRSNSRLEHHREVANNSRLSIHSSLRSSSISPSTLTAQSGARGVTPNRRKSISLSPQRQKQTQRKPSSPNRSSPTPIKERRNSRSRIPTPKTTTKPNGKTQVQKNGEIDKTKTSNKSNAIKSSTQTPGKSKSTAEPKKTSTTPAVAKKKPSTQASSGSEVAPLAAHVSNAVLQAAEVLPAVTHSEETPTNTKNGQNQSGNLNKLVRMSSRLSLLSNKNRADSPQSRKVAAVAESSLQEGEEPKSHDAAAAILEKSQKTLETIQKTVTEATDEIHKTINENLTDLKTLENDIGLAVESGTSPTPSGVTVIGKPLPDSRTGTADGSNALESGTEVQKSPLPPTQPIEASVSVVNVEHPATTSISVVPEVEYESADLIKGDRTKLGASEFDVHHVMPPESGDDFKVDAKRRSPDGQGGSTAGSGGGGMANQEEFLEDKENNNNNNNNAKGKRGWCRCCSNLFMSCRRSRCSRCCCCCSRKDAVEEQPVLLSNSATSSATTATNLQVIDEHKPTAKKRPAKDWLRSVVCCQNCRKKKKEQPEAMQATNLNTMGPKGKGGAGGGSKCGLCLSKIFCCRSVNKVDPTTGDETEFKKCCFCIPCRRKRDPKKAWQSAPPAADPEMGIKPTDAAVLEGASEAEAGLSIAESKTKEGCCKRFWLMLFCCRKKQRRGTESRRQSIRAPPPSEDTRRKLHNDLVEYTSKMKGAIPVLPLYLAWFCAFCNVVFPGSGTLLSGLFCLCVGIPRFSQFDSARARIGSFIINIIVAVAQFLTVLFCFVGWGWSIWWGTIMLKCARKLSKIKKVERLELEEEQRQAQLAAAIDKNGGHVEAEVDATKT